MSESNSASSQKKIRLSKPGGPRLVFWDKLLPLLVSAFRQVGVQLQIDGSESARTDADGNVQVKIAPGTAAANRHPFYGPPTTDGSTASAVEAGTVNGINATNLSLTISNSGTKYVYLDVTFAASVTANGYVTGFSGAISCALATGSSVPSNTSTHLYRQVAVYVSGVKTVQSITTSMEVVIRDNGSGSSTAVAIWGTA